MRLFNVVMASTVLAFLAMMVISFLRDLNIYPAQQEVMIQQSSEQIVTELVYFYDDSTKLCFAHTAREFTEVPCTREVIERLVNKPLPAPSPQPRDLPDR